MADVETTVITTDNTRQNREWYQEAFSWLVGAGRGLASMFGLHNLYDRAVEHLNNVNPDNFQFADSSVLTNLVNAAITIANTKGEQGLSQLNNSLNSFPVFTSASNRNYVQNAKAKIKDLIAKQEQQNAKTQIAAQKASTAATNYATSDASDVPTGQKQKYWEDAIKYSNEALQESGSNQRVNYSAVETNVTKENK